MSKNPKQKQPKSIAREAVQMLMHRSGWYSSTMHLSLISMSIITAGFVMLTQEQRGANFLGWGGLILGAATIYGGKRLGESVLSHRSPPVVVDEVRQPPAENSP